MSTVFCCVLVVLFSVALCMDFKERPSRFRRSEQTMFLKKPDHVKMKRSEESTQNQCQSLQGYDSTNLYYVSTSLFQHNFNDLSGTVSLAWVGDGTGEDYGKTFQDITDLINNTFIQTDFGMAIGPENSGKVILTGDLTEGRVTKIFSSVDFGNSFVTSELPFHPLMQITYNTRDSNILMVNSISYDLWLSEEFGASWRKIHETVFLQDCCISLTCVSFPSALSSGSVGGAVYVLSPDVYVSDDGGYTWFQALKGPHHYAILDSGGLLVAVEHNPSRPISQIKFSTDEGQCWHVHNFTDDPMHFTGLASEPGARSMNISLWGYRETVLNQYWVSVTVDFRQLLSRVCQENDYIQWLAHSSDISDPTDGCMLGYKERFLRLRKDSVCWNGWDFIVTKEPTTCPCTLTDFQCDFGFYHAENSSVCVEQLELIGHSLEFCLHGRKEQLQTTLSAISVSCLLFNFFDRFLVHRYSVLQQHAEANGIDGVDDLDTLEGGKTHYHDDSDEDLLE
uniref:Sortilin 1a n=1 Tax=Sinocyclocheilus grahami TaxID=75366 RepID=A0A672LF92_SINGR